MCRYHGLKFLAIVTPDGMLVHVFGPVSARMHDYSVLSDAGMLSGLLSTFQLPQAWIDEPDEPPYVPQGRTHYTLCVVAAVAFLDGRSLRRSLFSDALHS